MRSAVPLGGVSNDQLLWKDFGRSEGLDEGLSRGREQGHSEGLNQGYGQGYNVGFAEGHIVGYNEAIDGANTAIAGLQEQHGHYQEQVAAQYQVYESERDQLKQTLIEQAMRIRELEEKLVQRNQLVTQLQAKNDGLREANHQLAEENTVLREDNDALKNLVQTLKQANESLQENIEDLSKANREKALKYRDQLNQYNKTVVFINAIRGVVESVIEQDPVMGDQIKNLFAGEYRKAVDFKISVDEITSAPHEDKEFALMLPQTHQFIIDMLNLSEPVASNQSDARVEPTEEAEFAL